MIRNMLSLLPKLKLIPKPIQSNGITFLVPVKNEERWIEACLLSILDVSEKIVVVDSSTNDNTSEIVDSLSKQYDKIKHIRFYWGENNAIAVARQIALMNVTSRWVFNWEADQVAKTEGLRMWLNRLKQLNRDKYYAIEVPRLSFAHDLEHLSVKPLVSYQRRLFTYSSELKWVMDYENGVEWVMGDNVWGCRFPPWYSLLRWHEPFIYHCNIKDPKQMLEREYWIDYMKNPEGCKTLEEYTQHRVSMQNKTVKNAADEYVSKFCEDLIPYDKEKYGEIPKQLQNLSGEKL